jgi:hypothetical protein
MNYTDIMKSKKLIGRNKECERMDKCMQADSAQLLIIYGRRVGKTFLVNEYFNNEFDFKLTGAYNQPKEVRVMGRI